MTWKKIIFTLGMLVSWLLVMFYSHDYLARKINTKNQLLRTQIEQGNNDFVIQGFGVDNIVSSFRDDWKNSNMGVKNKAPDPEVSIDLKGFLIVPNLHSTLLISAKAKGKKSQARFSLELSNQKDHVFYQSQDLSLDKLNQPIDLAAAKWRTVSAGLKQNHKEIVSWSDMKILDALVVRFYDMQDIWLSGVEIKQGKSKIINAAFLSTCELSKLLCWLNNYKQNIELSGYYEQGVSLVDYEVLMDDSPLIWLLLSLLLSLLCVYLMSLSPHVVVLLIGLYAIIALLHQNWMVAGSFWLYWSLIPLFIGLLWWQKQTLLHFRLNALPLWIGSLLLALIAVILMPVDWVFVRGLPAYFIWAVLQQVLLGPVVADYCKKNLKASDGLVAVLVAVMFSIIHAPNHSLMIATLLAGMVWAFSWLKYRNLYANAFSHAVLALVFYQIMPIGWLGSARIGAFF